MGLSTAYSPAKSGLAPAPLGPGAGAGRRRSAHARRPRLATVRCSVDAAKQVQDGVATAAVAAEAPPASECFGVFCNIYDLKAEHKRETEQLNHSNEMNNNALENKLSKQEMKLQ